jgi:hypothetical protein
MPTGVTKGQPNNIWFGYLGGNNAQSINLLPENSAGNSH